MRVDPSQVWRIARREWSQKVRQRSFIISTGVMAVVMLAIILAPAVVSAIFDDDDGPSGSEVLVINEAGLADPVTALNQTAAAGGFGAEVSFVDAAAGTDPEQAIDDGAGAVLAITRGDDGALAFAYTNEDGTRDQTAALTQAAASQIALWDGLEQAGVTAEDASAVRLFPDLTIVAADGERASSAAETTDDGIRYGTAYLSAIVMYMVIMIYGMWVAQGVVEEKSSRIMEIMINAARPNELMFGKVIGIGMAGLTQLLPLLAIAVVGLMSQQWLADRLGVDGIDFSGIDLGTISLQLLASFLTYFLLGFLLYAALYAGVGSLVSRQEDVQTAVTPMTFAVVGGFFGAIVAMGAPDSLLARVLAIVPFTSPMAMMPRIMLGNPERWEIALSVGLLALTAYLAVMLAARIYRMGVLMYGQKPSLKVIFQRSAIRAAR